MSYATAATMAAKIIATQKKIEKLKLKLKAKGFSKSEIQDIEDRAAYAGQMLRKGPAGDKEGHPFHGNQWVGGIGGGGTSAGVQAKQKTYERKHTHNDLDNEIFASWGGDPEDFRKYQSKGIGGDRTFTTIYGKDDSERTYTIAEAANRLQKLVTDAPDYNGIVFRGMDLKKSDAKAFREGGIVSMKALSSTSEAFTVSSDFAEAGRRGRVPVVLKLYTRQGLRIPSRHQQGEREIIVPKGAKYKIEKVGWKLRFGDHYLIVAARQVN